MLNMITFVITSVQRFHVLRTRHLRGLHIRLHPVRTKLRPVSFYQPVAVVLSIFASGENVEYRLFMVEHRIE